MRKINEGQQQQNLKLLSTKETGVLSLSPSEFFL